MDQGDTELVPCCDLYVASVSATIRWAIACGVPVLNYDVFKYRYDDYAVKRGSSPSKRPRTTWRRWTAWRPTQLFRPGPSQSARYASSWGTLDGQSGSRLVNLFEDLAARRRTERPSPLGRHAGNLLRLPVRASWEAVAWMTALLRLTDDWIRDAVRATRTGLASRARAGLPEGSSSGPVLNITGEAV